MKYFLFLALPVLAGANTILTNSPAWGGDYAVSSWGPGASSTYGETITVPTNGDNVLSAFTFYISGLSISFSANVQAWSGLSIAGSPVFSVLGTTIPAEPLFAAHTFHPNVALTPGAEYILYFTIVGGAQTGTDDAAWGSTATDTYTGGGFRYSNAASDLNSATWSTVPLSPDLAFSATFVSGVPEPASFVLSAPVLVFCGFVRRRHKAEALL